MANHRRREERRDNVPPMKECRCDCGRRRCPVASKRPLVDFVLVGLVLPYSGSHNGCRKTIGPHLERTSSTLLLAISKKDQLEVESSQSSSL